MASLSSDPASVNAAERPTVYMLAKPQDMEASFAVRRWLFDYDFEAPGLPEDGTEPDALREELRSPFAEDHAFLIFYGRANDGWVRAQLLEISKAPGVD